MFVLQALWTGVDVHDSSVADSDSSMANRSTDVGGAAKSGDVDRRAEEDEDLRLEQLRTTFRLRCVRAFDCKLTYKCLPAVPH